jgi:probable F420-dependent oxidoreductase
MIDRLGFVLPTRYDSPLRDYLDAAAEAEELGYRTVWHTEVGGADAVGLSCAAAAATTRIRLATSILSVFTRTLPLLAMGAATLRSLAGPRVVLGLGTSTSNIVSGWHGIRFSEPAHRLEESVTGVRAILSGEGRDIEGSTVRSHGFRLAIAGPHDIPIHVAALGPSSAARSAAYADGIIATLNTQPTLADTCARAIAAGRSRRVEVSCFVRVAVTDDLGVATRWMRRELAWYASSKVYRRHFAQQGYATQMSAAAEAWSRSDLRAAERAIDDDMCRSLSAIGSPEAVRKQLRGMTATGADELGCYFMDLGGGFERIVEQLRLLAPE